MLHCAAAHARDTICCCFLPSYVFLQGWEELEDIIISGFANLMLAAGGSGGNLNAALREHDRCETAEASSPPGVVEVVGCQPMRVSRVCRDGSAGWGRVHWLPVWPHS